MHMSSQASHVHSWRLFASALWFHFFFWKLKLANQKVPDLNLHAFRYFFKSTVGKPLQVWLHVCAWWITAYGFADVSEIAKQSWCLSSFCLYCISRCVGAVVSDKSLRNIRMNVRAFAVAQDPYLQTRGRGQLHWESDISAEQRAAITHQGDEEALQKFSADSYDALNCSIKFVSNHHVTARPLLVARKLGNPELARPRDVFQPQTRIGSVGLTHATWNLPCCWRLRRASALAFPHGCSGMMPLVWLRFAFGCAFQQRFRILLFALRQQ